MKSLYLSTALAAVTVFAVGTASAQTCAGLYTSLDTNNDNTISADEMAAFNQSSFTGFDADGNGFISADEYNNCWSAMNVTREDLQNTGRHPQERSDRAAFFTQTQNDFAAMARDPEGRVTVDAYTTAMGNTGADLNQDGFISDDEAAADADRRWWLFDLDRSGTVEANDLTGQPDPNAWYQAYNPADPEGISMNEWNTMHGPGSTEQQTTSWEVRRAVRGY